MLNEREIENLDRARHHRAVNTCITCKQSSDDETAQCVDCKQPVCGNCVVMDLAGEKRCIPDMKIFLDQYALDEAADNLASEQTIQEIDGNLTAGAAHASLVPADFQNRSTVSVL